MTQTEPSDALLDTWRSQGVRGFDIDYHNTITQAGVLRLRQKAPLVFAF